VTVCNLCGCRAFDEVGHQVGMTTGLLFTYVRCTGCGLKFVSPRLTAEQNRALYSEDYFRGAGFDPAVHYVMLAEERALRSGESEGILGKIRLLKGSSSDLSILDAGCGTGAFLMALRAKGYRSLWGLDFSEFAARYTREATGATVLHGSLTDADFGDVRFDVINATEVIEHLRDPAAFFKRVGELLASGGIFVCSTGNATGLYARLLGRRWPYFHPEGHLYYFDPSTLATYFERAGLEVLSPTRTQQAELLRCEDLITNSQLAYMGASAPGMKGTIFHAAARVTRHVGVRAATLLQGKFALPIGVKR
jgi:2-polyprenyl-3-methyl-5-hydroxy-6-metoxy-1,4-benzoquinol methylase